jgi:hypothetical protein
MTSPRLRREPGRHIAHSGRAQSGEDGLRSRAVQVASEGGGHAEVGLGLLGGVIESAPRPGPCARSVAGVADHPGWPSGLA